MKAEAECYRPHGIKSSDLQQIEHLLSTRAGTAKARTAEKQSRAKQKQERL